MNAERLHALARRLKDELEETDSPELLKRLVSTLDQVVQQPQQAQHQQNLAEVRGQLQEALANAASNEYSPAWRQYLRELGVEDLLGRDLADRIEGILARNDITPAAAIEDLRPISDELNELQSTLDLTVRGFAGLGIGREQLEPGDFEIGVLIPRQAVNDELGQLAHELLTIRSILLPFVELATGSRPEPQVRSLASSDFTTLLDAAPAAAACIAVAVERVVKLYKTILEIRELHQRLKDQELPEEVIDGVREHVSVKMEEGLAEIAQDLREEFSASDEPRTNELMNEVRRALRGIANRVDQGFNFEVRVEPLPPPEDEEEATGRDGRWARTADLVDKVRSRIEGMQFINLSGDRILELPEGLDDQGDGDASSDSSGDS